MSLKLDPDGTIEFDELPDSLKKHLDPDGEKVGKEDMEDLDSILAEASYFLSVYGPSCPGWTEGIGDCDHQDCHACRMRRCVEMIEDFRERLNVGDD